MADRETAQRLAKTDWRAALECARNIADPWYRCQSLAWVARFAPDGEVVRIANEAVRTAAAGRDSYRTVAGAAWPIRALIERSAFAEAETATTAVLPLASDIEHAGSRAEALSLLIQAAMPASPTLWKPVFEAILDMPHPPVHWRHGRALRTAFSMVHARDAALATVSLARVRDERTRRRIEREVARNLGTWPRTFFW